MLYNWIIKDVDLTVRLLPFIIVHLRFTHVVMCVNNFFHFIADLYAIAWMYQRLFVHSPVEIIWIVSSFGVIMNKAAVNSHV